MSGVEVFSSNLRLNPKCPHGPTLLFSRAIIKGVNRKFYSCSACRDRKDCSFFLWADEEMNKSKKDYWNQEIEKYTKGVNHHRSFNILNTIKNFPSFERVYCHTCSIFLLPKSISSHTEHKLEKGITNDRFLNPSKFLQPLESNKKEAQFLFTENTTSTLVNILYKNNLRNVLCIGAPRISEFISNNFEDMSVLLLDIDKRYINFIGPLQFCWYNLFNHNFFLPDSKQIFDDFLQTDKGEGLVIFMDPPFGGRVEPIVTTLNTINERYKMLNKSGKDIPVFWAFPYFMEPHILNSLPNFKMLDYKVDYDNHSLFQNGNKGRKFGSPVRIFTNINPGSIELPKEEGYKYCKVCKRWVSSENNHCKKCNFCTSKDGRTYKHCDTCDRCVKPTWEHCEKCNRCAQPDHKCRNIGFSQECFHCKEKGHKKRDCPKVDHEELQAKRKKGIKSAGNKKKKLKTK